MDIIQRIRDLAYQLWEGEGRPEGRHDDHWREAERQFNTDSRVEGEGSYTGTRAYDAAATSFAHSGEVQPAAQAAVDAMNDPVQAAEMSKAEAAGKARSKGEDPKKKT